MVSEVARLRQQIEAECRSLQMLKLFSANASHEIISAKFAQLDKHYQQLAEVVGEEEATELSVTIYNTVMDKPVGEASMPDDKRSSDEGADTEKQQLATLKAAPELPKLPLGYVASGEPRPLIGENDALWIALADHDDAGLLIYEERRRVAFLVAEECITLLYTLMEHAQTFLDLCEAGYLENPAHRSGIATVRVWLRWRASQETICY